MAISEYPAIPSQPNVRTVHWLLTTDCNLACHFCYKPIARRRHSNLQRLWVIDSLAHLHVDQITFTGGEPMLSPDLCTLLEHSKSKGIKTVLHTNAILLTRERLIEIAPYLDNLSLALDGSTPGMADNLRGHPGYFDQVIQACLWAQGLGLNLSIKTMVCKQNLSDIPDMLPLVSQLVGSEPWGLWYLSEFTPIRTARSKALMFGLDDSQFEGLVNQFRNCRVPARIWFHSRKEIESLPYRYLDPLGNVLCHDKVYGSEIVVGSIRDGFVGTLWGAPI